MTLALAALVLSLCPDVSPVVLAQSKVQIIKGGKKGGAKEVPAPANANAEAASQAKAAELAKKSSELDAKSKELEAKEAELKAKEATAAEEQKARDEKQQQLKKRIEKHGQDNANAWDNAAGALSGD